MHNWEIDDAPEPIAIIGMAGRFPGARNIATFWENLCNGVESLAYFSAAELLAQGRDPAVVGHPNFVGAEGALDDIDMFDAAFFGFTPREAEIMDPQHRLCLECAWEALEHAGYQAQNYAETIGVYLGASLSNYLIKNLLPHRKLVELMGAFPLLIHNDKDFVSTTIAHKLHLTGPSITVGTACSTSLVAVHLACQSLLTYQCHMALAGGISLQVPQKQGYVYQDDGIYAPDGHCRTFDAQAQGTVGGSGVGVVVLKRLSDALADGDQIYALIRGSAVNNDGGLKVGFTAPAVDGQAAVIIEAQAVAGVPAETIGYIEAHGTGTALGDPIEIAALTQAFRVSTQQTGFCAIGSVKTNIGHLDAAAGVAGLIKTVLALHHKQIPPSLHYQRPNPQIDFVSSPFFVNTQLREWHSQGGPRRAGVSAFGIGGTNAHVILEEAPPPSAAGPSRPWHVLTLSAKTSTALEASTADMLRYLQQHPTASIADIAYTLNQGRKHFAHRRMLVCHSLTDAVEALSSLDPKRVVTQQQESERRGVVFMFPGQGTQHTAMAAELYRHEPVFRQHLDECARLLAPHLGLDIRTILYPASDASLDRPHPEQPQNGHFAALDLSQTWLAQPALFAVEYALAQLWMAWGVQPRAMIGHSLGEYVAACIAGVFSLEDALLLVARRGQLLQQLPGGAMLAVSLAEHELQPWLHKDLALAATNGPNRCVVAGTFAAVATFERQMSEQQIPYQRLHTSHAFHSAMVEPILARFAAELSQISFKTPQIPFVSNLTGTWISAAEARSPQYWVQHLRHTVRFTEGIATVLASSPAAFLELGPSHALSRLVQQHPARLSDQLVLPALHHPRTPGSDLAQLYDTLGKLWLAGHTINWSQFYAHERRQRLPLPSYPFERKRFWIDPPTAQPAASSASSLALVHIPEKIEHLRHLDQAITAELGIRGISDYHGLEAGLNTLCAALIYNYICSCSGLVSATQRQCSSAELRRSLNILPIFEKFLNFMLDVLSEDGLIAQSGDQITFLSDPSELRDTQHLAQTLQEQYPAFRGLINLIVHCASHYPSALSTLGAAIGVLYPQGSGDLLKRTLGEETVEHSHNGIYIQLLKQFIDEISRNTPRAINILEVGVGGGRLTWELAPILQGRNVTYHVTDISKVFVEYAREEATRRGITNMTFGVLDISQDPLAQGYTRHTFDIVLGLDVVHATRDIPETLRNLQVLLAPQGIMGLIETVKSWRWLNMIWGLAEGWWYFNDTIRRNSPLLDLATWERVTSDQGFATVLVLPQQAEQRASMDCGLILGQQPALAVARAEQPLDQLPEKQANIANWFYLPSWQRADSLPPAISVRPQTGGVLVFANDSALSTQLLHQLHQQDREVFQVYASNAYARLDNHRFVLNPAQAEDYEALLSDLRKQTKIPATVLHLWNVTPDITDTDTRLAWLDQSQDLGIYSLLWLARALGRQQPAVETRITVVSNNMQEVLGADLRAPEKSTLLGAVKIIPREYPTVNCSSIDILIPSPGTREEAHLVEQLLAELARPTSDPIIAYRGRYRWTPTFTQVHPSPSREVLPRLRPSGVYLIVGGLGGIGLSLAQHLAHTLRPKLVLTSRSGFMPREQWSEWLASHPDNDRYSKKIRTLQAMEAAGAELLILSADVANREQMEQVVAQAIARFGSINGVIHSAGIPDEAGVIHRRSRAMTEKALASKVRGALVLDHLLQDMPLDFFVACSSIGSILYKLKFGEVGYVAANDFLNAFAHYRAARHSSYTVTINWTDWQEVGMWAESQERLIQKYDSQQAHGAAGNALTHDLLKGISNAEGIEIFRRVLEQSFTQAIISTQDLFAMIAHHDAFTPSAHQAFLDTTNLSKVIYQRPSLDQDYVAPRNETEQQIAQIWQTLLGIDQVGIHDNFFELGGDSLLAIRVLSRLRDMFQVNQSLSNLFETPTIAQLAERVETVRWARQQAEAVTSETDDIDQIVL